MSCNRPLQAWRSSEGGGVVFWRKSGKDKQLELPCGKCVGCLMDRAMMWKARILHEASLYQSNLFVTLTYADDKLPPGSELVYKDFQLFMKRLRQALRAQKIRFYVCGEYGERDGRPHWHVVLFNCVLSDLKPWRPSKGLFRSALLEREWGKGHVEVGQLTPGRAAYVAGYVTKKAKRRSFDLLNRETGEVVERCPEFQRMSLGVGRPWFECFGFDCFPLDGVVVAGKRQKFPRYYLGLVKRISEFAFCDVASRTVINFKEICDGREARAMEVDPRESTPERRAVREEVALRTLDFHSTRAL